jgi:hypothetical protein
MADWLLVKEVRTEIQIGASSQRVWQVLTDFARYPEWNPFIQEISGILEPESRLKILIRTPRGKTRSYEPLITKLVPESELRWVGKGMLPGLLDGEHIFSIKPLDAHNVLFVQSEIFNGLLVPMFGKRLDKEIRQGFEEMNEAMKRMIEKEKTLG